MAFAQGHVRKTGAALALVLFVMLASASLSRVVSVSAQSLPATSSYFFYVATNPGPKSKGIYVYRFDAKTGQFTSMHLAAEMNSEWIATRSAASLPVRGR